jgi:hypothetical protein
LSHPGELESTGFEEDEDDDSKEFVIFLQALSAHWRAIVNDQECWRLDA